LEDRVTPTLTPQMVLDINTNTPSSNPSQLVAAGSTTYFTADDGVHGLELWKSDGMAAATMLVKDIYPGGSSNPGSLTNVNGTLFFTADDGVHGVELWKSDGTEAGTVLVANLSASSLTNVNGTLFFTAYDSTHGVELWKSTGTADGAVLVNDINPGSTGSYPVNLTDVNGTMFFAAADGTHGRELWKSDGTAAGTVLVKDILPGSAGYSPSNLTNVNGTLFFTANDGTHGIELWKSDGTAAGTVLVMDIFTGTNWYGGPNSSGPSNLTNVNGTLFFTANDGTHGIELWKSDGTASGTILVKDISLNIGSYPSNLTEVNGTLFFRARDNTTGDELWKSDGTAAGTVLVTDILSIGGSYPSNLTNVNGTLFFTADDGTHGVELWKSDGTAAGTTLVKDIFPGGSNPGSLTNVSGTLMFAADDYLHGVELWKSDGTAAGTTLVKDINANTIGSNIPGFNLRDQTEVNGTLFFSADDGVHGIELWKSDGTAAGTTLVMDISPGGYTDVYGRYYPNSSSPGQLTNVNGTLFFTASDGILGRELWKSDGTEAGTSLVASVNASNLTAVNGTLFFAAGYPWSGQFDGIELWKSDGTTGGTVIVKDIFPGQYRGAYTNYPNSSFPSNLTNVNGTLFFTANDGIHGRELWKSDGTASGTVLVTDIRPGSASSGPSWLTNVNGTLFFAANNIAGAGLWKSDGTAAGTVLIKDFPSKPSSLANADGTLFFWADDGIHGTELWRSDGTAAGTVLVKDISPPGGVFSYPAMRTNVNGTLFFTAYDGTGSYRLWRSDGTAAGTVLVANLAAGNLTNLNGTLIFTAGGLWQSDGTAAGTVLVANLWASQLTAVNGTLFFTAYDGFHGYELWKLVDDGLPSLTIGDVMVTEGHAGTRSATFTVGLSAVSAQPVTVAYATADASATAGSDYQAASGTLTFTPGERSKIITVLVNGDHLAEPNENFLVNLSAPTNATIADGQGVGTIIDDEPRINIGDVTVIEGNTATRAATFTVNLSAASSEPVSVTYVTANATATAGSDYQAASGTLTIPAGQTTGTITVPVNGDRLPEANESYFVNLSSPTNAMIANGQGVGIILDDEPRISISDVTRLEGKNRQTTLFVFTVSLSTAYDQPVTMSFATANGTATTSNSDYVAKTGALTFAPGETTKTITIEVKGDNRREANETFFVDLSGLSSNSLFTMSRGIGTILNDD